MLYLLNKTNDIYNKINPNIILIRQNNKSIT